jgi:hypothetical protein
LRAATLTDFVKSACALTHFAGGESQGCQLFSPTTRQHKPLLCVQPIKAVAQIRIYPASVFNSPLLTTAGLRWHKLSPGALFMLQGGAFGQKVKSN